MHRIALVSVIVLYSDQTFSQNDICQTIAETYTTDRELKELSVPLRKPTPEELSSWPDYSECKGFQPTLIGYYEHPSLPQHLLGTEVVTGMRVSYTEILKAPPDCGSRDWKKRYGDALFNFYNRSGLSAKLLDVAGKPIFVIGGFGKSRYVEGLTEAILVNNGTATKVCSFARTGETITASNGSTAVCTAFQGKEFEKGTVTQIGRHGNYELQGYPGVVEFRSGKPDQAVLKIDYSSLADTYPIRSIVIESQVVDTNEKLNWQRLIVEDGFNTMATEWIWLNDRPTAIQMFPMQTVISWPDKEMEICTLDLAPSYKPAEPQSYGGAQLGEAIGP